MKLTLYLLFFALAFLTSCHKEQAILPNGLNGCDCANEVSAEFYIEEMTTPNPNFVKYTDTDTIYADKNVRFRAKENDAEYTWYIGAEVLTTQEVTRYFSSATAGQTIIVSLVVKKNPNTICFPTDDGKDSLSRTFFIVSAYDDTDFFYNPQPRFEGVFRMKDFNSSDSIDIYIQAEQFYGGNHKVFVIENYDGYGSVIQMEFFGVNYNELQLMGSNYNSNSRFYKKYNRNYYELFLIPGEELEAPPFNIKKYKYFGRKLN